MDISTNRNRCIDEPKIINQRASFSLQLQITISRVSYLYIKLVLNFYEELQKSVTNGRSGYKLCWMTERIRFYISCKPWAWDWHY